MHQFLKFIFGIKLYMFWTVPLSIISFSLYTQRWYMSYRFAGIQWETPDDGQRNRPKHVEFYSKNKFEKLVHLAGFIIGIYHDAWSPERQISVTCLWLQLSKFASCLHECCAAATKKVSLMTTRTQNVQSLGNSITIWDQVNRFQYTFTMKLYRVPG